MNRLVVVESPTKARTIRQFLSGEGYQVEASMGHIRDLPSSAKEVPAEVKGEDWATLGVRVDNGFEPLYVIPSKKKKVVRELKAALKNADELFIATDEDREGESIGWHLLEVLNPSVPVRRMVFHEITQEAIEQALESTRDIDRNLVDAQETRRILDRLVGYEISPLLWKKIKPKLSAGRVQSVAVRLLVQREIERIHFVPASYWDLKATLAQQGQGFGAKMTHYNDLRLASGRDFDENTGRLKEDLEDGKDLLLMKEKQATSLAERLADAPWRVVNVDERQSQRKPYAPFITSTLQQEASRKLSLSAGQTMQTAQRLYENGHITYMRTDSSNLSKEAMNGARAAVKKRYGDAYLSPSPRIYSGKVRNAQEAHEAIRPAGSAMKTAKELKLRGAEARLYDLIWKRTVASQMANARLKHITAHIEAGTEGDVARFRASGKTIEFAGFFRAYVEGSDDPNAALEDRENPLPPLKEGDTPTAEDVEAVGHETKPPSRFTEASLIKMLEQEGIGRPSTYASIIDTIQHRNYARSKGSSLVPTFWAFATNNLLEAQFDKLVDVHFTANMEQVLDDIAAGDRAAEPYLRSFYKGDDGLQARVEGGLESIDPREICALDFTPWQPHVVRVGRYGPYVEGEVEGETETASLPDDMAPGDVTKAYLDELLARSHAGDQVLGIHPEHDMPILLKNGPFGPYVQLGDDEQEGKPKRMSLPDGVDPSDVTFDLGHQLINLPRTLGEHPESGKPVQASIGRYGPYVRHQGTFASLKKDDDVLTVDLPRALELLRNKNKRNAPLRVLGAHPETGADIEVRDGRYGPYVKHKKTNASLPDDVTPEDVTLQQGIELINQKLEKKGKRKGKKTKGKAKKK